MAVAEPVAGGIEVEVAMGNPILAVEGEEATRKAWVEMVDPELLLSFHQPYPGQQTE